MAPAAPGEEHACGKSGSVKKPVLVVNDVVNAVGRDRVARLILNVRQVLPPSYEQRKLEEPNL